MSESKRSTFWPVVGWTFLVMSPVIIFALFMGLRYEGRESVCEDAGGVYVYRTGCLDVREVDLG